MFEKSEVSSPSSDTILLSKGSVLVSATQAAQSHIGGAVEGQAASRSLISEV